MSQSRALSRSLAVGRITSLKATRQMSSLSIAFLSQPPLLRRCAYFSLHPLSGKPKHQLSHFSTTTAFASASHSSSAADSILEHISDQYSTAKDEFEIAMDETLKKSIYGAEDRKAAREELETLKSMIEDIADSGVREEVKGRIWQRVRELENAVANMEELALED